MKTYTFRVVLEPDEDGWHIYVPELEEIGASTWGYTQEEAIGYIREVLEMIIEEFEEEGKPLPSIDFEGADLGAADLGGVDVGAASDGLAVMVTV